jgi:hypothetical protein
VFHDPRDAGHRSRQVHRSWQVYVGRHSHTPFGSVVRLVPAVRFAQAFVSRREIRRGPRSGHAMLAAQAKTPWRGPDGGKRKRFVHDAQVLTQPLRSAKSVILHKSSYCAASRQHFHFLLLRGIAVTTPPCHMPTRRVRYICSPGRFRGRIVPGLAKPASATN